MSVTLYLAIPCYNEAAVLPETARRLLEKFTALRTAGTIGPLSRICMIDDGSRDETWQIISDLHTQDPVFSGIRLSRNRGHQNALLCGLMTLRDRADCVISMDADLFSTELDASGCNWISGDVPQQPLRVTARIRYRQPEQPCTVTATGADTVHVSFETPQRAITRGQAVVFYDGDTVLGGGTID